MEQILAGSYRPRDPQTSDYHRCTQDHFERLEMVWDDRYERRYGFWRPYVMDVMRRYLECGDPHFGFARVKCTECQHEYLLPFSCKRRHFCPSCHQKRVVEFGAWLYEEVLKAVPHRQWVFSIPKILRKFFMTDRRLPCKLSRCAWKVLHLCLTQTAACDDAMAGAAVAVHTFGDFQNFNPHLHIIVTDGCFYGNGRFLVCTPADHKLVEEMFRHEVFKMLKSEGNTCKTYDALDWLAQLTCHIPSRGEQMVRYYGYYSNKCRGQRKKAGSDEIVPSITEPTASFAGRKSWAQLIQKIYEVDPLICPKCHGRMRVIAFIEDDDVIRKILVHLGLWDTRNHDPPHLAPESFQDLIIDESYSQLPQNEPWMM